MRNAWPVIFLILGCAHISEKAANVQVHDQMSTLLEKCERGGPVVGIGTFWGLDHSIDYEYARNDLREKAAAAGADSVVMLNQDWINGHARIQGVLFNCYGPKRAAH